MRKSVEVEINLTPREAARAIWEMDQDDQIRLLAELARVGSLSDILMQMQAMADDLHTPTYYREDDVRDVQRFVNDLHEYLCE